MEVDPRVQQVSAAIAKLGAEDPRGAARLTLAAFPKMRAAKLGHDALETRAMRVMAIALIRTEGAIDARAWPSSTADERAASYTWAVRALRGMSVRAPTDPGVLTDLAEALSMRADTRAEARKILELLAPRDLISGAHGWAALARARLAAGDVDGRNAAVERCAKMARVPSICKVRGEPPPATGS
jgi:hypothetical protein